MGKRILISVLAVFLVPGLLSSCLSKPALEVKAPAKIVVNKLEVSPKEPRIGEQVNIHAEISNIGGLADNYTAILYFDGSERAKTIISISCNETKTIFWQLNEFSVGRHTIKMDSTVVEFSAYIEKAEPAISNKETEPDDSYVQVSDDVGYYPGQAGVADASRCLYIISVLNKHDKWSLRDVYLITYGQQGGQYRIADLIKPHDTVTFNRASLPSCRYNVTWNWQPPSETPRR